MKRYKRTLTIAGSDSGGGAGIQADLKAFSALDCFGMSVITAITAQNTVAVTAIHPIPIDVIGAQIDAVLSDLGADAVKIGMLHSPEVIAVVAQRLAAHGVKNIVLDPVMVAKSGDKLLLDEAVDALKERLLPMATVITPNLPEASVFLDRPIETEAQMEKACHDLARFGAGSILLKGGHAEGELSRDLLYISADQALQTFEARRIETPNLHGTGCTLSSAIAAHLARGLEIKEAVGEAKRYISGAILAGAEYKIGNGHGPVHHFYRSWS